MRKERSHTALAGCTALRFGEFAGDGVLQLLKHSSFGPSFMFQFGSLHFRLKHETLRKNESVTFFWKMVLGPFSKQFKDRFICWGSEAPFSNWVWKHTPFIGSWVPGPGPGLLGPGLGYLFKLSLKMDLKYMRKYVVLTFLKMSPGPIFKNGKNPFCQSCTF